MSENALLKHAARIARHERYQFADGGVGECVRDLAAEVHRLRENEVCADTECRDLRIREMKSRVEELETMWQWEHTERIRLEEQVRYLAAALEAARKEEPC